MGFRNCLGVSDVFLSTVTSEGLDREGELDPGTFGVQITQWRSKSEREWRLRNVCVLRKTDLVEGERIN